MKRKIAVLILAFLLIAVLTACEGKSNPASGNGQGGTNQPVTQPAENQPVTQPNENQPAENQPATQPTENKPVENQPTSDVPSEDNTEKIKAEIASYKAAAIAKLDELVNPAIAKMTNRKLASAVQNYYNAEKETVNGINDLETAKAAVNKVVEDTKTFVQNTLKPMAIEELNAVVNPLIEEIPYAEIKASVQSFYNKEIAKISAAETLDDIAKLYEEILGDTKRFISDETAKAVASVKENEQLATKIKEYLKRLLAVETTTAYDYLPAAMCPTYANNIVSVSDINLNFNSFTNVSDISKIGYGEQWQMVVANINQSVAMAKVFNVIQTALNAAGNAVDIYLTNSPSNEIHYSFEGNGYSGVFEFNGKKLVFNISMTNAVSVPAFGSVKPVVKMEYDLAKETKGIFINLGDAYKVKYVIADNSYEMATTYGITVAGKSASRSSFLSVDKDKSGKIVGHIYEYTTYQGSDMVKACADFYVENGYVSVVGNKSSGMIGFSGYINELYLANSGRLLGYEVREELTVAGVTKTYNTLWFNLWDIQGISSVRVTDKTDANKSSKSTADVYLNGSSALLSPTYNKLAVVKTSRKYDIELRTRYCYTYDSAEGKYVSNAVKVPMLFIQEEDYNSFASDMKKDNGISASVTLDSKYLNKILNDYDTLIDIFIQNKEAMSSKQIAAYLAQYN